MLESIYFAGLFLHFLDVSEATGHWTISMAAAVLENNGPPPMASDTVYISIPYSIVDLGKTYGKKTS